MNKNLIKKIYTVLLVYEDVLDKSSEITMEDYLRYLDRLSIVFLGLEEYDVYYGLRGLKSLGTNSTHKLVKSMVFHMISEIKKGEII